MFDQLMSGRSYTDMTGWEMVRISSPLSDNNLKRMREISAWEKQHLDPENYRKISSGVYLFKNKEDALLFSLRWK